MVISSRQIFQQVSKNQIRNFDDDGRPLSASTVAKQLLCLTDNWPRRIDDQLWILSDGKPYRLNRPPAYFGWLGSETGKPFYCRSGRGFAPKQLIFRAVLLHAQPTTMQELEAIAAAEESSR